MKTEEIFAQLNEIFRDLFDDDSIDLKASTTAADIPEWDSVNHINMVVSVEGRFGIRFQTSEIEKMKNIGEMVQVIASKTH